jgi:hypothetical protein
MSNYLSSFEDVLDSAIRRRGFRISSRQPLEYRLKRYIELVNTEKGGETLSAQELDAIAGMLMMTDDAAREMLENAYNEAETSGTVTFTVSSNDRHVRTFTEGSHPMVRRSQVSCCSAVCESRPVMTMKRVALVSPRTRVHPARSHPMKLRSSR